MEKDEEVKEEESVFDEAEVSEELPETGEVSPDDAEDEADANWSPKVVDESPKEALERKGVKENRDGKVLTIKEVGFTRPRTKDESGITIPPKEATTGDSKYYTGKLKIRFEEDNLVEYYPNFKYFVNETDGKQTVSNQAKIYREGENEVAKICKLAVPFFGKPEDEIRDQEFYDFLVGKKVTIETATGTFNKKKWFRNDIIGFVQ